MTDTEKSPLPSFLYLSCSPSGSSLLLQKMTLSGKEPETAFMLPILSSLHASQGPCLLSSTPQSACKLWRDRKFKMLFLWFLLSVYSQAKMEAQGVSGGRTGLPDTLYPLLTRQLRFTEQDWKDFATLPSSPSFSSQTKPSLQLCTQAEMALWSNRSTQLCILWTSLWLQWLPPLFVGYSPPLPSF